MSDNGDRSFQRAQRAYDAMDPPEGELFSGEATIEQAGITWTVEADEGTVSGIIRIDFDELNLSVDDRNDKDGAIRKWFRDRIGDRFDYNLPEPEEVEDNDL